MNTRPFATSIAMCVCVLLCGAALAGEVSLGFQVPNSAYSFDDTPPCEGWRQQVLDLFKDEEFVSGLSAANPYAGAVVATIGFYDGISAGHGGEISKLIRKLHGGSYSVCLSAVYAVPGGVTDGHIELSNRHGAITTRLPLTPAFYPLVIASDDWSAWRNVEISTVEGRTVVAATASNWLHNGASNQVLKVIWTSKNKSANNLKQSFTFVGKQPPPSEIKNHNPFEQEPVPAQ